MRRRQPYDPAAYGRARVAGTHRATITVRPDFYARLADYCASTGDSVSSVVEAVIATALDGAGAA